METKFCQSCGMPLQKNEELGTNHDGSKNEEYVRRYVESEVKTDHDKSTKCNW